MSYRWDYEWQQCPGCRIVWKTAPPELCSYCGISLVVIPMPPIPWDDIRHGSESGYHAGCRCEGCTKAHAATWIAGWHKRNPGAQRRGVSAKQVIKNPVGGSQHAGRR